MRIGQIERGKKCTITGLWSRSPEKRNICQELSEK